MENAAVTAMRGTLGYSRFSDWAQHNLGQRGFTLIELLLVFALLATLLSLVGPAGLRAVEQAQQRSLARALTATLQAVPVEVFSSGRATELDAAKLQQLLPEWPSSWTLELSQPLAYSAQGVARGGQVTIRSASHVQRLHVLPGSGAVESD
jgi:prepilin-type N-terminal cleavage/methylation domain-containing protein